jgi:hypothetical protein
LLGTLPPGSIPIFSNGDPNQVVDFYYPFGNGFVYYSTIPLDFYAGGNNNFDNIYAPNEAAFQASLALIPEPTSLAVFGFVGLIGAGVVAMRKRIRAKA